MILPISLPGTLRRPRSILFTTFIVLFLIVLYFLLHDARSWHPGVRKTMLYYENYENSGDASFGCHDQEFVMVSDAQYYLTEGNALDACSFHTRTRELVAAECDFRTWCAFSPEMDLFYEDLCPDSGFKKLEVHFYCYHCPPDHFFSPGKGCFRCPDKMYAEAGTSKFCKTGHGHGSSVMGEEEDQGKHHHHG